MIRENIDLTPKAEKIAREDGALDVPAEDLAARRATLAKCWESAQEADDRFTGEVRRRALKTWTGAAPTVEDRYRVNIFKYSGAEKKELISLGYRIGQFDVIALSARMGMREEESLHPLNTFDSAKHTPRKRPGLLSRLFVRRTDDVSNESPAASPAQRPGVKSR